MAGFIRFVKMISTACGMISAALLGAAILVVCQMVFIRYILNGSTVWQTDFITYSLVAATLLGSPYVLLLKGHVNVDLLPLFLGKKGRLLLAVAASTGGLGFALVLAWFGFEFFYDAWVGGWRTDTIWELPLWIPYLSIPVGIGILALQYVADILALLTGRDMPFAMDSHNPFEGE